MVLSETELIIVYNIVSLKSYLFISWKIINIIEDCAETNQNQFAESYIRINSILKTQAGLFTNIT